MNKIDPITHFDKLADKYGSDYVASTPMGYSFRVRRSKIMKLIEDLPQGSKVLDIGCGPGVYVMALLDKGFEVWGVDPAPEMIRLANDYLGNNPKVHFSVGDVENLSFPKNSFNSVIAAGLFEYLDDPSIGFRQIHNVLTGDGIFVVSFPYFWSFPRMWDRWLVSPLSRILRKFRPKKETIESKEFSPKKVAELIMEQGFKVEEIVFYNTRLLWTPFDRLFPSLAAQLSKMFEKLTPAFLKTGFIVKAICKKENE
jgi:ubiquinone/menaquinone biosynthesis C-methylase UbiE